MIQVNDIHYAAGRKKILQQVSFTALPGEFTVLLGPNGAGKSTLLRLLSGDKQPQSGSIQLNGRNLQRYSTAELACCRAVLTQHYALSLPFTCEEVVLMGRYPHFKQSPAALDKKIVADCMEEMQVSTFSNRQFGTLSGGEQQRVQLARVLAQLYGTTGMHHKILLLDEPTASMDYLQQQLCMNKAKEVARQNSCVIVVLHDLNLAAQFADRIILLKQGRIFTQGTPHTVLQPGIIRSVYGVEVNILQHEQYAFPFIVPALHPKIHSIIHS